MNPVTMFYALITANTHRWVSGAIDWTTFETSQRMLWDHASRAHVIGPVLAMLRRSDLA